MNALPDGIIRTPEGVYVLRDDSHLSRWIEQHKRLDIARGEIAKWAKYIPFGGTVIDAGASLGDHTCTYAQLVGPSGRVLAFEPNALSFAALSLNFADWKTVLTQNMALAERSMKGVVVHGDNIGAGFFTESAGGDIYADRIDLYASIVQRLDFIHLDCEGMERAALLGATALLAKFKPAIVLEINHGCLARYGLVESDVLATLADLGYRWEEIESGHGPSFPQRDIIALPL